MNTRKILERICSKQHYAYAVFTSDFRIVDFSQSVTHFSKVDKRMEVGEDIREFFWELYGIEEQLVSLQHEATEEIKIPMLQNGEVYYSMGIEAFSLEGDNDAFVLYIEEERYFQEHYVQEIRDHNQHMLEQQYQKVLLEQEHFYIDLFERQINRFNEQNDGIITPLIGPLLEKIKKNSAEFERHFSARLDKETRELAELKARAEEALKSKSLFLANMSHEIRTPLNAIIGFISLLQAKESDPEKLSYLTIVKESSDSLLSLINDILDFSKIESGNLTLETIDFDAHAALKSTAELFKTKALEKQIAFSVDLSDTIPRRLEGDPLRLKQILANLLSNAIKFTPEKGSVLLSASYENGRLNVNVTDSGIGIPKEKQKHIFEAFSQADNSTVRKYGGTGLGLSISAELARLLGGTLTLESEEGKGSTFSFSLPMQPAEQPEPAEEAPKNEALPERLHGHLLLVDDIRSNQMFTGIILKQAGITYDIANNGLEAVEFFKKNRYDLILMDENMPELSGTDATQQIRKLERECGRSPVPIIAMTANAFNEDRQRLLDTGMSDYISKPITPEKLLGLLNRHLSSTSEKRSLEQ